MSFFNYKNPLSSEIAVGSLTVDRDDTKGTTFSVGLIGGYMEVWSLDDLKYTIYGTGNIEDERNRIPIQYYERLFGGQSNTLTINNDLISSGRRRLGMLVYVHETDTTYQYVIPNYENLFNPLSAYTGGLVITGDTSWTISTGTQFAPNADTTAFVDAWLDSSIEGVSGVTRENARWRIFWGTDWQVTGGTVDYNSTGDLNLNSNSGNTVTISGLKTITGGTYFSGTSTLTLYNNLGDTIDITGFTGGQSGTSGSSGSSGTSGSSGSSGTSGSSGSSGTSGSSGESGTSGSSGSSGTSGSSGESGTSGSSGSSGTSGSSGESGTSGSSGSSGTSGSSGESGTSGSSGSSGTSGSSGSSGTSGSSGSSGTSGSSGSSGTSGSSGSSGTSGSSGISGVDGTNGTSGSSGSSGTSGSSGSSGTSGSSGSSGTSGSSGSSGTSGSSGESGTSGSSGSSGTSGSSGESGTSGSSGSSGTSGSSGESGTSGSSGSSGTSGSSGESGTSGSSGSSGTSGSSGSSGTSGSSGSSGTSGSSGSSGTSGSSGESGTSGSSGSSGTSGSSGSSGTSGSSGSSGTSGSSGSSGTSGSSGSSGTSGSSGSSGTSGNSFTGGTVTYDSNGRLTFESENPTDNINVDGFKTVTGGTYLSASTTLELYNNLAETIQITGFTTGGGGDISVSANTGLGIIDPNILYTIYNTTLSPSLEMDVTVGGIEAGTTVSDLTGKTFVDMFNDLLFPTVLPTYTQPTIVLNGLSSKTKEVGDTEAINVTGYGVKNDAGDYTNIRIRTGTTSANVEVIIDNNPSETSVTNVPDQFGFPNPNSPNSGFTSIALSYTLTVPTPASTTSTVYYDAIGDYGQGLAKKDNKGDDTTTSPISSGTKNSSDRIITGIYPYFWGVSSTEPTTTTIAAAISGGTANKVLSQANSTITITFNATEEYLWFAHLSNYNTKTSWYVAEGNEGDIGSGDDLFGAVSTTSVDSPETYWTGINYKIYISNYPTTTAGGMQLRN